MRGSTDPLVGPSKCPLLMEAVYPAVSYIFFQGGNAMAGTKDFDFVLNVRGLSRRQGKELRDALIQEKDRIAPKAKGSIAVGKWKNFAALMGKCRKELEGGNE